MYLIISNPAHAELILSLSKDEAHTQTKDIT